MLTKEEIENHIDFHQQEDGSLRYKNSSNYIILGNNTYTTYISISGDKFRQELPDTIQQLIKQINKYRAISTDPNSIRESIYEHGSVRNKLKVVKAKKNWY